jgi:type IV pilus assembly protein PilY1
LGCDDVTTTCTANRKFLFGPDVVKVPGSDKLGILVGSGDREKPLLAYGAAAGVQNYFFSIIDQPDNPGWLDDDVDSTCGDDIICRDALTQVATGDDYDPEVVIGEKGWRLPLASEEQVVTGSLTVADVVNFSTHKPAQPEVNSCEGSLGKATTYNLNYEDAKGDAINIIGGGLVPTAVAGMVELDPEDICDANGLCGSDNEDNCDDNGNCEGIVVPFCIGCGGEESAIGGSIEGTGITWSQPISRVYWNIKQ